MTSKSLQNLLITCLISTTSFLTFSVQAGNDGEFKNQCAMGLALGKNIDTDCSINLDISGKTYCFGNEDAKALYLEDTKGNLEKAEKYYAKSNS